MKALQESQNLVQKPNEENIIEGIDSEEIEKTNEVGETRAEKEKDTDKEKVITNHVLQPFVRRKLFQMLSLQIAQPWWKIVQILSWTKNMAIPSDNS